MFEYDPDAGRWIAGFVSGIGFSLIVAVVAGWLAEVFDGRS